MKFYWHVETGGADTRGNFRKEPKNRVLACLKDTVWKIDGVGEISFDGTSATLNGEELRVVAGPNYSLIDDGKGLLAVNLLVEDGTLKDSNSKEILRNIGERDYLRL